MSQRLDVLLGVPSRMDPWLRRAQAPPQPGHGDASVQRRAPADTSFEQALRAARQRRSGVHVSAHARERLGRRGIPIDGEVLERLERGMDLLASKGGRSALVMLDSSAFVVNVPNRTVVTAMELAPNGPRPSSGGAKVFTQIDSAVMV